MSVLDCFNVVEVPRTFSIAEVRILKNKLSFNMCTASELSYPPFIHLYVSQDRTQIAIKPCQKEERNAIKFFTPKEGLKKQQKTVAVGNRTLTTLIRQIMCCDSLQTVCVPGIRYGDENVIIFDFTQSYAKSSDYQKDLCVVRSPAYPFAQVPTRLKQSASKQKIITLKKEDYIES